MDNIKRKTFATTIDPKISHEFKVACVKNGKQMNEVLEEFMKMYAKGEFLEKSEK